LGSAAHALVANPIAITADASAATLRIARSIQLVNRTISLQPLFGEDAPLAGHLRSRCSDRSFRAKGPGFAPPGQSRAA